MMTMLHSVWSGGGSAAGRRRSLLALGALLALVASLLIWTSPTHAQNAAPPIALGSVSVTNASNTMPVTATLTGSASFDPDNGGAPGAGIVHYNWEVVTEAYAWLALTETNADGTGIGDGAANGNGPSATFGVPSPTLAARYGNVIQFRLTVTDDDKPAATDSMTVTFNVNQGPEADIALSATLADPTDIQGYDDNGNSQIDEVAEVYTVEGVIDGPGENGNAVNEWDIMEGSRLVLDGSGSSDPDGRPIPTTGHDWDLVFRSADGSPNNESTVSASIDPFGDARSDGGVLGDPEVQDMTMVTIPNVGQLTNDGGAASDDGTPHGPVYVYYKLTVTDVGDQGNATNSKIVKIVIHDQPANPRVVLEDLDPPGRPDSDPLYLNIQGTTDDNKFVVLPGTTVDLTARGTDRDDAPDTTGEDATTTLSYSWEGATATTPAVTRVPGDRNGDGLISGVPADLVSGSTARFVAPSNVEDGKEFTVTVTVTDVTGRTGEATFTLVVAQNRRPEAVAPAGTPPAGTTPEEPFPFGTRLWTPDGADGGDVVPVTDNSLTTPSTRRTGVQTLRGFGFDPDGGSLIFAWTELALPLATDVDPNTAGNQPGVLKPGVGPRGPYTYDHDGDAGVLTVERTIAPFRVNLPRTAVLTIDNAFSEVASFKVPEVNANENDPAKHNLDIDGNLYVPVAFTVIDSWGVTDTEVVYITIIDDNDPPRANAGPDQHVLSGDFVRLSGILSADPDPGTVLTYSWRYIGMVETHPKTEDRKPITAAEEAQGFVEGRWFPYDGISHVCVEDNANIPHDADTDPDLKQVFSNHTLGAGIATTATHCPGGRTYAAADTGSRYGADNAVGGAGINADGVPVDFGVLPGDNDAEAGDYHPTAGGLLFNIASSYPYSDQREAYPYFDAPRLTDFNSVKFQFALTVVDDPPTMNPDTDTMTVTVTDGFFSGTIVGPDFCTARSLGGAQTYPFDGDGDGVAETCSLDTTRRAAVARQNALETLAALNSMTFSEYLHGMTAAVPSESIVGTCKSAPRNLGDSDAELAADSCATGQLSSPPAPVDPAKSDEFFSGVITGPGFCTNNSLGGATTYAMDSDGDGVADVCSLPYTRREAVARQNALHRAFLGHAQYPSALAAACAALGTTDFGDDSAADLARDLCNPQPPGPKGTPLPTRS